MVTRPAFQQRTRGAGVHRAYLQLRLSQEFESFSCSVAAPLAAFSDLFDADSPNSDFTNQFSIAIEPMQGDKSIEPCADAASCNTEALQQPEGHVMVSMSGLPAADSYATSGSSTGEAESLIIAQCFDPTEQVDRKWRAFNDVFEVRFTCVPFGAALPVRTGDLS